jgi:hypothetical protein
LEVTSDVPSDLSALSGAVGRPRGRRSLAPLAFAAVVCLAVAVAAGAAARAELGRQPTATQRAAAAATAMADRWRSWPAGRIFPSSLEYSTSLLTTEAATRVGIAPQSSCMTALDPALARLAAHDHCQAALRATYLDQLQGVLYTIGVLAFPSAGNAGTFAAGLPAGATTAFPLSALALPGTASSEFSAAARQAATARHDGPFVVLTVSGYADGEPAGAGEQARPSVFAPAGQLAGDVVGPLTRPATVNCANPAWSC